MDAAPGVAPVEGGQEEGRALGGFEYWRRAEVDSLLWIGLCFQ